MLSKEYIIIYVQFKIVFQCCSKKYVRVFGMCLYLIKIIDKYQIRGTPACHAYLFHFESMFLMSSAGSAIKYVLINPCQKVPRSTTFKSDLQCLG